MISNVEMLRRIRTVAETDGRYRAEGFIFVLAGLEYTVSKLPERRHLTGQELSVGIADYAREQYGFLARTVLESWGLRTTDDFGEIVYLLIDDGLMSKTEEDRKEDFFGVYEFDTVFDWQNTRPRDLPDRF